MASASRIRAVLTPLLLAATAVSGCASADGPPRIEAGTRCVACGMETRDLRWAAVQRVGGRLRVYDSIECAVKDRATSGTAGESALCLTDFPTTALHRSDSLWVVQADLPSPMGGGLAAFLDRGTAERVALDRGGRFGRLASFDARDAGAADAGGSP